VALVAFTSITAHAELHWRNIAATYKSFADVKPTLVNLGDRTVYLSRVYPFARLLRFNPESKRWEIGNQGFVCGTVPDESVPIAIEATAERNISVDWWNASTGDDESNPNPNFFIVEDPSSSFMPSPNSRRPIAGRYKLTLNYALMPWTSDSQPKPILSFESPEFNVVP
jgi:hypothetical protein